MLHSTNSQALNADGQDLFRMVNFTGIPFWKTSGRTFNIFADDPTGSGDGETKSDASDDGADDDSDEFDKDRALATIRKQREREKAQATELKTLKADLAKLLAKDQERADADKSELEKAQLKLAAAEKAHEEAQAKLRKTLVVQAIERAATKHNARDAEVVAKLIDLDALELDDDGAPTNAEQLVKELLKEKTYLVASEEGNTNGNGRQGVPPTPRSSGSPKREDKVKENEEKLIATRQYTPIG